MIRGSRITVLISGSIAAYKSAMLVSQLAKEGARVSVAMTRSAQEFVTPLTFQTLSGNRVSTSLFDESSELSIGHLALASQADVVVVSPATANIIAKMANGIADDLVSSVLLATRAPVLIAPAMNVNMWENPLTRENVEKLKERGVHFVGPEKGVLACGWVGNGRLAAVEDILHGIESLLSDKDMRGIQVVVSAGGTVEPLGMRRFLGVKGSSRLALEIVRAAELRGAQVSLVAASDALGVPSSVAVYPVNTAKEMRERVLKLAALPKVPLKEGAVSASEVVAKGSVSTQPTGVQIVFAAANEAGWEVTSQLPEKPTGQETTLTLRSYPDLLETLGEKRREIEKSSLCKLKVVGFMSGVGKEELLLRQARDRLAVTKADLLVGKFSFGAADQADTSSARLWLMDHTGRQEEVSSSDYDHIAQRIISASLRQ